MINWSEILEPIAAWFRSLGIPEPIVRWGHPLMMGIVVFVMGSAVGASGWQGRLTKDKDTAIKSRIAHRQLTPWMFSFIALGFTGGVLSLQMQHQPITKSPHFWTALGVLLLLGLNGAIALSKFGGEQQAGWRKFHAYLGTAALGLMFLHAVLGLNLGLSL